MSKYFHVCKEQDHRRIRERYTRKCSMYHCIISVVLATLGSCLLKTKKIIFCDGPLRKERRIKRAVLMCGVWFVLI